MPVRVHLEFIFTTNNGIKLGADFFKQQRYLFSHFYQEIMFMQEQIITVFIIQPTADRHGPSQHSIIQ